MSYSITFKASAMKALRKIPPSDRERILTKIIALQDDPRPSGAIKLTSSEAYRIRQGSYRIIYTITDAKLVIEVIRIGHRRDIYD